MIFCMSLLFLTVTVSCGSLLVIANLLMDNI